jgi:formate C-acetyltransferase
MPAHNQLSMKNNDPPVIFDPRQPMTLDVLRQMGEWMALGFYEGLELPWPRSYGLAFRRLYENMPIGLRDGRLLLPSEPFPLEPAANREPGAQSWYWPGGGAGHHATGMICDFMHDCGIHLNKEIQQIRQTEHPRFAQFMDDLFADLRTRLCKYGGYTHSNPDMRRVVDEGFDAMERELDQQISAAAEPASASDCERALLAALKDYAIGVRAFHSRAADAMDAAARAATGQQQSDLQLIASSFRRCFLKPAGTFVEGLLAVHFAWLLDGCDSIGRPDQVLGCLYEADLAAGRLDVEFCRRLIDELFHDFERLNAWNMQLGGTRPDGTDGTNALTREFLEACRRNKLRRPNMALRIGKQTPQDVLTTALEILSDGTGRPALYNDDLYVQSLLQMDLGLTPEDAREYGFGGCTETMIAGLSNVGSLEGSINLAKALELAIYDGWDPLQQKQVGPHTGTLESLTSFDGFARAVKRQIGYLTDAFVTANRRDLERRFTSGDPKLYRTFFTRDCVQRRKSFEAGGARYNWAVVCYAGIANLIDGLGAIRQCVYEDKSISPQELLAALKADFIGYENVHRRLASAPKFGNDDPTVDDPGIEILREAWADLYSHETPRGGRYVASCIPFVTYGQFGARVGALPDGRRSREPLADSAGPSAGRDTHGPTAMLRSVAKLPQGLAVGTPVVNIRIQKRLLASEAGRGAVADLIRGYFDLGGLQLQISVVSREDMLAAQKDPHRYRDLIVRIGGYSEYFTNLDRQLQETVLARTEYA